MGFAADRAKEILEKHNGDVELAIEELASNLGRPDDEPRAGKIYKDSICLYSVSLTRFI